MTDVPLFDPTDFRIPPGIVHVCAGGTTPFLHRHDAAMRRHAELKSSGIPGWEEMDAELKRTRAMAARLWGVDQGEIGFVSNVAEGVSMVAESIDWRPGDTIAVEAIEYPSVVGPFARRTGVRLRVADGSDPERLAACVDDSTRLIATSYVSYLTGERTDLAAMRKLADSVGALLVVDYTQASGCLPIAASVADFAFSACYKWMLGETGVAIAYWNRRRQPTWEPVSAGWYSLAPGGGEPSTSALSWAAARQWEPPPPLRDDALRFTRGNPAHGAVFVLGSALDYLADFATESVERHVLGLGGALLDRLESLQIPALTPPDAERRAANICVASERAEDITVGLQQRGVWVWNGHGRVRVSFHGYNCLADVDRVVDALRAVW